MDLAQSVYQIPNDTDKIELMRVERWDILHLYVRVRYLQPVAKLEGMLPCAA